MTKQQKRLILLNVPYVLIGLFATNLGEAWRIAEGANVSEKLNGIFSALQIALSNFFPSLHPFDLMVGIENYIKKRKLSEQKERELRQRAELDERLRERTAKEQLAALEQTKKRRETLICEQTSLKTELVNLKGLFSGKRRKEIEARLADIELELKNFRARS